MGKSSDGRRPSGTKPPGGQRSKRWSADVARESDALDLEDSIFTSRSPKHIALSLKHSAETSKRRKGTPLQSAMSMLNFYINRAGRNLSPGRKRLLERAKPELRKAFGREH
jgi:hypothetical protein